MNPSILLNGVAKEHAVTMSLVDFLSSIGLANKPVIIELNEKAIYPRDYATMEVAPGDKIEVVALAAGG